MKFVKGPYDLSLKRRIGRQKEAADLFSESEVLQFHFR